MIGILKRTFLSLNKTFIGMLYWKKLGADN